MPGLDIVAWQGLLVPAGTPPATIDRLNTDINAVLKDEQIKEKLTRQGLEIIGGTAAEFADFISKELVMWRTVVEKTGAKVD